MTGAVRPPRITPIRVSIAIALVGSLALIGFPGTSGFFSKDALIDAVHASHLWGSGYAYFCVLTGVFITALYTFRMFFMTFHGRPRMDHHTQEHLHESPWVVTVPLMSVGGMPVGVQLMGQQHEDARMTGLARWFSENLQRVAAPA